MRRARFVVLFCWLSGLSSAGLAIGCAGTAAEVSSVTSVETSGGESGRATEPETVAQRREGLDEREARLEALESRLALSTAEARALRAELDQVRGRPGVVRIGSPASSSDEASDSEDSLAAFEPEAATSEPSATDSRPVLRLYGPAATAALPGPMSSRDIVALPGPPAPSIVLAPPVGALDRLPVVLLPGAPDQVPAIPELPITVAAPSPTHGVAVVEGPAEVEYRAALAHVSAHRWPEALAALGAFVMHYPDHSYADNAMYWRGEVLYAEREYAAAITELSSMIQRFPAGNKVPDALLRIGFCLQRLGDGEQAREVFRRVREQYPGTVAARTASREDA